jgi:peptide/nickel transport system permease protein
VITLAGLQLPMLVSGALVVEVVFGWPGMGRVAYDAVMAQDLPVVLAAVLLATLLVIAGSLAADLALAAVDPRARDARKRVS